ncbi:MAG TPA: methyltransferase domain-containing protein [Candidatus Limnocylindrales bacterium]|nr:methyltransferase domain-containing protein [Candidatus Limnocylindrales bacterium]
MEQIIDEAAVSRFENETWSRCADSYPETFHLLTGRTIALLVRAAGIRAGTRVLDLGAGPGDGTAMLAETGAAVAGVDFSRTMVAAARRRHPGLTFHEGDAEVLPFADGVFDAIVSNFVVHHLARPALVFREVSRVLAPGGRFAFIVWASPEEQTGFGVFFAAVQAHHTLEALPHGPLFGVTDRAVYDKLARGAGFQGLQLTKHEVSWEMDGLDPLLRGLCVWGNIAALPQTVQHRIETTTRANAAAYQREGRFVFPHSVLLGVATKS